MTRQGRVLALGTLWLAFSFAAGAAEIPFKKHVIDRGTAESCCVVDVNKDGQLDIYCGDNWYVGPTWERRETREAPYSGEYKNSCADWPFDVNGDGWMDVVTAGFFNMGLAWVENPTFPLDKKRTEIRHHPSEYKPWPMHSFSPPHFVETVWMVDIDGDGRKDVLSDDNEPVRWIEIRCETPGKPEFVTHKIGDKGKGHGIGYGDVNGDGRVDVLTPEGWYEGPADPRKGPWTWHGEWKFDAPGDPMLTLDVNGDGLNDVLWGHGHNYGLYWEEQDKAAGGKRTWTRHVIDKSWSQPHTMTLADLSGDGLLDIVTGKRYRAHNGHDAGGKDPLGVYWFELDRKDPNFFKKHVIDFGTLAGGGLQMPVIDIDKDGDLDILCPGKGGLYLFENQGSKK